MDYYVIIVMIGGKSLRSYPMRLADAEQFVKDINNAAPNTSPQIVFDHTRDVPTPFAQEI